MFEALFILRNGTLITGAWDSGIRGEDHYLIRGLVADRNADFMEIVKAAHLIVVVPETKTYFNDEGPTAAQEEYLEQLTDAGYTESE